MKADTGISSGKNGQGTQLLFIDDEAPTLRYIRSNLSAIGYDVVGSSDWQSAQLLLKEPDVHPRLVFVEPLGRDKSELNLKEICTECGQIPVIVLSSSRDPRRIVQAIRAGASDYLPKPIEFKQLCATVSRILDSNDSNADSESKQKIKEAEKVEIIFCTPEIEKICATIHKVAASRVPVLIQGESGVGKDLFARMLHQESDLRNKPFVKVNCAAMPSELVESELFGYRKGAFTGAHVDRPGKFEFASGGTIFLDEIGEFTPSIQAKLLQVLQEGKFTRLGNNQETAINVRVVAATNCKLEKALKEGTFREDLYYRLNVVNIHVPPLRERREEIPLLCEYFLKRFAHLQGDSALQLPMDLKTLFASYHWPGNVRELENTIKRYIVLRDPHSLRAELSKESPRGLSDQISEITAASLREFDEEMDLKKISRKAAAVAEKSLITRALEKNKWNRWRTSKELRVSYKTLLTKIDQHKIRPSG